jgi:hypothetical protein
MIWLGTAVFFGREDVIRTLVMSGKPSPDRALLPMMAPRGRGSPRHFSKDSIFEK